MSTIILGVGTSHSPLLVLEGAQWELRSRDDMRSRSLSMLDGRDLSYVELAAERGERYAGECTEARFAELAVKAEACLDRLADALAAAAPDVVVVVGDDQGELFADDNQPAVAVFHGDELLMLPFDKLRARPAWAGQEFWKAYLMDLPHHHPGEPELARGIVEGLIERGVDVAGAARVTPGRGFGHAFGFVVRRLLRDRPVPLVPVLINTYFPPNAPTAARCAEIGRKLGEAIASVPSSARVAVIASGGLSHFVCEEELDRQVLDAITRGDFAALGRLPQRALRSGTSEIRNWIVAAAALQALSFQVMDYLPVHRTPAGTGIGLAFATWR